MRCLGDCLKDRYDVSVPFIGKVYLLLVFLEAATLTGVAIAVLTDSSTVNELVYYAVLSVFVVVSFAYFAFDAVIKENKFQFWTSLVASGLLSIYFLYEQFVPAPEGQVRIVEQSAILRAISLPLTLGICVLQLVYLAMAYWVKESFGWRMYRKLGGDAEINRMYHAYLTFMSVLKLDLEMAVILVLMVSFFGFAESKFLVFDVIMAILSFCWAILGRYAVRKEKKVWLRVFFGLALVEPAYIAVGLWYLKTHPTTGTFAQFLLMGVIAIFLRIYLLHSTFAVYKNFGRGLTNAVFRRFARTAAQSVSSDSSTRVGRRMTFEEALLGAGITQTDSTTYGSTGEWSRPTHGEVEYPAPVDARVDVTRSPIAVNT